MRSRSRGGSGLGVAAGVLQVPLLTKLSTITATTDASQAQAPVASNHPGSRSLSAVGLYDTDWYIEVPARTLEPFTAELGDDHVDLLKLDIEGSEYDVVPTLDLRALGVRVFAPQLHHTASVRAARSLIEQVRAQGYQPVAIRPVLKIIFLREDQFAVAVRALSRPGSNGSPGSTR
jgi:methyltransferase FkbM-like protein